MTLFREFGALKKCQCESRPEESDKCNNVVTFSPPVELSPHDQG